MNIPSIIRVGSMDYKVILTDEILVVDCHTCKGMIEYEKHEIKIKEDIQDKQGMEVTLLHEIMHAIVRERNFEYEKNSDEGITEEIACGLHQLIRDNPLLFKEEV